MKVLFAVNQQFRSALFSDKDCGRIAGLCDVLDTEVPAEADKDFMLAHCEDADIIITGWGTGQLDADIIARAKNLKLVTHAGGSIKVIACDAMWDKGVRITSASVAIAYGVAEFCLGQILTAPKRVFWGGMAMRDGKWRDGLECFGGPFEIYQQKIGVIGAGHVGRHLISLLKNFSCDILLFDPYCPSERAEEMGVTKVDTLEEMFSQCRVVSLCAPSTDETANMIRGEHFKLLPDGAVFINTARSAIVNQDEMMEELRKERFVACLDVTDIEPTPLDHPLRSMPNVLLTPHEAGAIAENRLRMGTFVADEIEAFMTSKPLHFEVTQEQLARIG
ncbi:MAG: hydroxyacid dehydrogenase [Phycisphaerae bacterium]|nr:hydroxyacid dehydrogenase [Phycisphaerae bacterium]